MVREIVAYALILFNHLILNGYWKVSFCLRNLYDVALSIFHCAEVSFPRPKWTMSEPGRSRWDRAGFGPVKGQPARIFSTYRRQKMSIFDNNTQHVLVFQGGGALGAYQAGAFENMAKAGYRPNYIAGIGAINAALIAGNRPEHRVEALRSF